MTINVSALVLDVDGVVVKTDKVFSVRFAEKYGIPLVPYKGGLAVSVVAEKLSDCLVGKADLKEEIPKHFERWNWKGSVDDVLKFWFEGEKDVNMEVLELVKKVKARGIPVYLASNNEKYRVDYLINTVGLGKYFDHAYSSAELGYKKPEKEFYTSLLQKIGVTVPSQVMFWDDDPENVEGARKIGINSYVYTDIGSFKKIFDTI